MLRALTKEKLPTEHQVVGLRGDQKRIKKWLTPKSIILFLKLHKSFRMKNLKIISVGGSIIIPKEGFDVTFLRHFRDLILAEVKKGQRFILVIGGGATCRAYQSAAAEVVTMSNTDLDQLGIYSTVFNAQFVRMLFGKAAHTTIVENPTKKMKTNKKIMIGAGWKPGCSTDNDAVLLAKTYGAKEIINLSNIDYVYESDPKINPLAKKLERVSWKELRQIIGSRWTPGANVPFDPVAAKTAEKLKLKVSFVKGTNLDEVKKVVRGEECKGTVIGS